MNINTGENNRKIREVWIPGNGNANEECYRVGHNGVKEMKLQATYHGDRDEFWVHISKEDQTEISVNLRQVTTIVWA